MPLDTPPLVGRARLVSDICTAARRGRGTLLKGPAGSGGSRLLSEVTTELRRSGLRVARVVLPPSPRTSRTSAFRTLLDRATAEALPQDDLPALRDALLALQLRVLALDDAHLLDGPSGALVLDLARAGTVVIANTSGAAATPEVLRLLLDEGRLEPAAMPPLDRDEIAELVEHLLGGPGDAPLVDALVSASSGRPGSLTEVVADGRDTGAIAHVDGLWRLAAPLPAPRSLRSAVLEAFGRLPPDQRGWLAAVATAGSLADDLACRIARSETIAGAERTGWTERDEARRTTRIVSAPVATAVIGTLDPRARTAVLRRLVIAACATERPLDDRERIALARWRIELGQPVDPDEVLALAGLADIDPDSRERLLRAAVAGGAPAQAALAEHLRQSRRAAEALAMITASLPEAATEEERVALVRVSSMAAGIVERRSSDALTALDAYLAEHGDHPDLVAVRSSLLLLEGRPREAVDCARAVLESEQRSAYADAFALMQATLALREIGDLAASAAAAQRFALSTRTDPVFPDGGAMGRWLPAEIDVAVGLELDAAESAMSTAYAAVPADRRATQRPLFAYTLGCIRVLHGEPAAGSRLLREADAGSGAWHEGWLPRILAELTIAQTLAGALDDAEATLDRLRRIVCPPVERGRVGLAAAQLASARGDADGAIAAARETEDHGRAAGLPLDAFDGAFAALRYGDPDAPARLLALGPLPEGMGRAAQRAYAAALLSGDPHGVNAAAEGLWGAGLRLHAVEATARAAALSAPGAAHRLVAWLARVPSLRLPHAFDGEHRALTSREREVALLASTGVSDRGIASELGITVRTAQTHLSRAFAKLGVHRRSDLRGLVEESPSR